MLNQEELFLRELEKDYILIDADTVRREYNSIKPREVDIILNDEYGSTQYLNMNLGEKEFEEALTNAEKNNCLFGIWRKNIG
jgi:hypothetical protein